MALGERGVANRYFEDVVALPFGQTHLRKEDGMMEVVAERCRVLAEDPDALRRRIFFR
ncbi:MAG: hypothetical protein ACK4G4_11535 [Thermus sp.]|uniref:hypothetical protein n=1 Tax=Thermus sp. TaxID=275 RepID=UPI00391DBD37